MYCNDGKFLIYSVFNSIQEKEMSFVQYDKKEEKTTVGMPELKPVEPIDGEGTTIVKEREEEGLSEDVYSFILAAPVFSWPFVYAFGVVLVKYLCYSVLWVGIAENISELHTSAPKVQIVKFLLIPVAISMQEDLIHVYAYIANLKYDKKVLIVSENATLGKLIFSMSLRLIDGLASLSVNFFVMLQTHDHVRQVFLNFAALHFLQSIDDVFFLLLTKGFFGDAMEVMSEKCKKIIFPRRQTNGCIKKFDTVLLCLTFVVLVAIYGFVTSVPIPPE